MLSVDIFNSTGDPSKDRYNFFRNFYQKRKPALIKGGASNWPLIKKWNKEYIVDISGNEMCTLVKDSRPAFAKEQSTLKNYFENKTVKST